MQTACGKECSTALRIDASRQMAASVSVVSSSIFCWEKKWWPNQLSPFTTVSKSSPTSWRSSERRHFGPLCIGIVEIECWYCVTWLPTRRVGWPLIIKNVQQIIEIRARYANLGLLQVRIIFSSGKAWPFLEFQQDSVLKKLFFYERWRRYSRLLEHVTQRVTRGAQLDWWLVSILISQNACNG